MENIVIAGASGFVGKALSDFLLSCNYAVTGIGTSADHPFSSQYDKFTWVRADTSTKGDWQEHIASADTVINLAGRSIFKYWTPKYKQAIYNSRILTTRHIVAAIAENKPVKLLNTSAAGIYGDSGDLARAENDEPGTGFLAEVCKDWEKEALIARGKGAQVSIMRFGVVLGKKGGALAQMLPMFKAFAGGPLGSGKHWFPWIHIQDLIQAVFFLAESDTSEGVYNFTAPGAIQHRGFVKALGSALNRPSIFPAPAFMVRLFMGDLGRHLLFSQKVIPENLQQKGYNFKFPEIDQAFDDLLRG